MHWLVRSAAPALHVMPSTLHARMHALNDIKLAEDACQATVIVSGAMVQPDEALWLHSLTSGSRQKHNSTQFWGGVASLALQCMPNQEAAMLHTSAC